MLSQRKMKESESVQEYLIVMRELASRGMIEMEAVFEYVINGINDSPSNKAILYGAKSVSEFKEKLKNYEKMQGYDFSKDKHNRKEVTYKTAKTNKTTDPRCFNCGAEGHKSKECKHKNLGSKCFKCNEFGHIATNCKKANQNSASQANVNFVSAGKISEPLKVVEM